MRETKPGTFPQPDRDSSQNLVSKSAHEMEETESWGGRDSPPTSKPHSYECIVSVRAGQLSVFGVTVRYTDALFTLPSSVSNALHFETTSDLWASYVKLLWTAFSHTMSQLYQRVEWTIYLYLILTLQWRLKRRFLSPLGMPGLKIRK